MNFSTSVRRKRFLGVLLFTGSWLATVVAASAQGVITTVAGGGPSDGTPALSAGIPRPVSVARDTSGRLYFCSDDTGQVYRVDLDGRIRLFASLGSASGLAIDAAGNVFVAQAKISAVKRINGATGAVTNVTAIGFGFSGDGGPASSAILNSPWTVAVDASGNLFVADVNNQRIRRIDAATGNMATVAGNGIAGFNGDGIAATSAQLNFPYGGVAVDPAGNLFIGDSFNSRIRRVDAATGIISTVATEPALGVSVDSSGNLYYTSGARVRRVDAVTRVTTTVAGTGSTGSSGNGGPALAATFRLSFPVSGLTVDASSNVWIADADNYQIRLVNAASGIIDVAVGTGTPGDGGPATSGSLGIPQYVAVDSAGNIFIADQQNRRVRRVDGVTGIITTAAGGGTGGDGGQASAAGLCCPAGVAIDRHDNLFIGDGSAVRRVDRATGIISTVAGSTFVSGVSGDGGLAKNARLSCCYLQIAVDREGNVLIADSGNQRIRRVDATTTMITTIAGNGASGFNGDGILATAASLSFPTALAIDANGNLFIADTNGQRIRRVDAVTGFIATVAGTGTIGFASSNGDGGPAASARVGSPQGVAFDSSGNLFVSEFAGGTVRRIDATTGIITTVAGGAFCGFCGDDGPATSAGLNGPRGIAIDEFDHLYIADVFNGRIRRVSATATPTVAFGNASFVYDGNAHTATAIAAAADGQAVAGSFTFVYSPDTGSAPINAGVYTVFARFRSNDTRYTDATAVGAITIRRASASVTPAAASKTYGSPDPELTGTLTGFLPTDNVTAAYNRTPGESVAGGPYAISSTLSPPAALGNYDIIYDPAPFTIHPASAQIRIQGFDGIYDGTERGATGSASGVQGEDLTAFLNLGGTFKNAPGGTVEWTFNGNANYSAVSGVAVVAIRQAPLTIRAGDASMLLGAAAPSFSATYSGFQPGDGASSLNGSLVFTTTATEASPVGSYHITPGGLTSNNYTIRFVPGTLSITYNVCALYDAAKVHNSGSTIPIKLELCDAGGRNAASTSVVVHATELVRVSDQSMGAVEDSGQANPDDDFWAVGPPTSYRFNLKTTGLVTGAYELRFTVSGDPLPHAVVFQIR